MKRLVGKLFWLVFLLLVTAGLGVMFYTPPPDAPAQRAVAETRQLLRQQGFKTDLADFNFSTSPELRTREAILNATASDRNSQPFLDHPNLMETAGNNTVIVVWKQASLKRQSPSWPDNNYELSWDKFRQVISQKQSQIDAACVTVMSGPIQFNLNAANGNSMLLPHLAVLKNLTQMLDDRAMLALHDGNREAAWTNLMAATRLVTAWKVEPAEVSHLVQFADAKLVFAATWQALQTNGWTDEQLASLQQEWESANFVTNLPEIAAFKRASDAKEDEYEQVQSQSPRARFHEYPRPQFSEFVDDAMHDPYSIWRKMNRQWIQNEYFRGGMYEDEKDLLFFYRDREIELRNAVRAQTWMQMRQLPGVINEIVFQPKYPHWGRFQMMSNQRKMQMAFQRKGSSFLGSAAEAEAKRRIIITAVALERYYERHGSYPQNLAALAPEFLKAVPLDFMDGQPLRYRLGEDGHFLLYSVGKDCVDNGGKIQPNMDDEDYFNPLRHDRPQPQSDIVWPLPASNSQATTQREKELKAYQERLAKAEERGRVQEAQDEALRQATVKKLLAMKPPFNTAEPRLEGKPLTQILKNFTTTGTEKLTLDGLLSLKQIVTGEEPDIATFEVPVSYDALKHRGELRLSVDGGAGAELEDCTRATNGDCLLAWNTTYEPPGPHALQAQLFCHAAERVWQELEVKGPVKPYYSSNLVQFFEGDSLFTDKGATLYGKLPESNGIFSIELKTPDGTHLKTISGTTSNGIINVEWNLIDDHGHKYTGDSIKATYNITLPDSGRSETSRGP